MAVAAAAAVAALLVPALSSAAGGPTAVLTSTPTPATGKAPLTITFDGTGSSDSDGTIVSWTLSYGDGTPDDTGALVLPSNLDHTYSDPGNYTATLTVTDDLGASDSASVAVTATNVAPTASLTTTPTPATGKAPLGVTFNGSGSSDSDGSIASWRLQFGDGTADATGTGAPPSSRSHTYSAGSFTATLTVTDDQGATGTDSVAVTSNANVAPTAVLTSTPTPATGKAPLGVTFNGSGSTDSDGSIASWKLQFGDGTADATGTGAPPASRSHTYSSAGSFTATLTVTDDSGATGQATVAVTPKANVAPTASLTSTPTPATGKAPLGVTFNGSGSTDSDGSIASWKLQFGDGTADATGTGAPPSSRSHTYMSAGSFTATLTVTDDSGATGQATVAVTPKANVAPTAVLTSTPTPATGKAPLGVTFNGSASSDSDGSIASWTLDFGDGTTVAGGNGVPPSSLPHTYAAGTWTAVLTVKDDNGATDTDSVGVSANNPPTAALTADKTSGPTPLAVTFNGSGSSDSDGTIASWTLAFGDGGSTNGTGAVPSSIPHTYANACSCTASLTVTDNQGAQSAAKTLAIHVTTNQAPVASLSGSPSSGTVPLDVTFDGSLSNDPDGIPLKSWSLDYGDLSSPATGTGAVPSSITHTYSAAGTYNAVLTVTDSSNASRNSAPFTITVNPQPAISVADVSQSEGNSGTTSFVFQVTLSAISTHDVSVAYQTVDGSATAGSDYTLKSGTLAIPAGTDCRTTNAACQVTVAVSGDTLYESNETFMLNLSNPLGATIADGSATGTIVNDDLQPVLMIQDNGVTELNQGSQVDGAQQWSNKGNLQLKDASGFPNTLGDTFVVTSPGTSSVTTYSYESVSGNTLVGVSPAGSVAADEIASQPRRFQLNVYLCDPTKMSPNDTQTADCIGKNAVSPTGAETASGADTTVQYSTGDGRSLSTGILVVKGQDYIPSAGTLTIPKGATSAQITVQEIPNTIPENQSDPTKDLDRWFLVNLASPTNATIRWGHGLAHIFDDDGLNPPSSTTGGASSIGTNHATVAATVNPNNAATDVYVQYGPTDLYGSQTATQPLAAGNSPQTLSFSLTGLAPGTTYHYQVAARHADGSTGYGKDVTFTTNAPPTAVLTADKTSGQLPLPVTFNGAGSADSDGSIASWVLAFGDGTSTSGTGPVPSAIPHTYGATCNCAASLTVTDNQGASSVPATRVITVGNPIPPPPGGFTSPKLSTYDTTVLGPTSVQIVFTVDPNGAQTKVWVEYGTTSSYGRISKAQTIPAGPAQTATFVLKNLTPDTRYHYRLHAAHTTDSGAAVSNDLTFKTPLERPMKVTVKVAKSLRPNSKGMLSLTFACAGNVLKRCNGQALLELGNKTAGFKPFSVLPKHRQPVRVQLKRAVLKQLLARKRLRLELTVSVRAGGTAPAGLMTRHITILAPRA